MILSTFPFWYVKCTTVQKKIEDHVYFVPQSISFPKMYNTCFEQNSRTETIFAILQTTL